MSTNFNPAITNATNSNQSSTSNSVGNKSGEVVSTIEKTSKISSTRFFAFGLSICHQQTVGCGLPSDCFSHGFVGNLFIDPDNKLYILTVAHGLTEKLQKYLLVHEKKVIAIFDYSIHQANQITDIALIPIGEFDPTTNMAKIPIDRSYQNWHFHV